VKVFSLDLFNFTGLSFQHQVGFEWMFDDIDRSPRSQITAAIGLLLDEPKIEVTFRAHSEKLALDRSSAWSGKTWKRKT
jgi:hypothetical protein